MIIFDLDGTLALIEHRRHHVGKHKNWPAFYAACVRDQPHTAVITIFIALWQQGHDIQIWSGRSDIVRSETIVWLAKHTGMNPSEINDRLVMRRDGDYTPDEQLKERWLDELEPLQRARIEMVFDDRDKVVAMWRRRGLTCLQVEKGDF
jgi:hypothetical protein